MGKSPKKPERVVLPKVKVVQPREETFLARVEALLRGLDQAQEALRELPDDSPMVAAVSCAEAQAAPIFNCLKYTIKNECDLAAVSPPVNEGSRNDMEYQYDEAKGLLKVSVRNPDGKHQYPLEVGQGSVFWNTKAKALDCLKQARPLLGGDDGALFTLPEDRDERDRIWTHIALLMWCYYGNSDSVKPSASDLNDTFVMPEGARLQILAGECPAPRSAGLILPLRR